MDKVFARFIEKFGAPIERQEVPPSSIEYYRGKLPSSILDFWTEHGWCGYGDGIFWMVNPQEYEGVLASWLSGTELEKLDSYHLIARSAFGDLYLWGEKTGSSLEITSILSRYSLDDFKSENIDMDKEFQIFLFSKEVDSNDYGGLFNLAKKKLGILNRDEMYGFVPALMLGGPDTLKNLEKVKAVEHLIFLSQIADLQSYNFPDI